MGRRVLIGPANYAGQATEFASALQDLGGAPSRSAELRLRRQRVIFPVDFVLPGLRWAADPVWKRRWRHQVERDFEVLLVDGGLPLTRGGLERSGGHGLRFSRSGLLADLTELSKSHRVGVLLHGSEIRDPDVHAERHPLSPFRTMDAAQRGVLSANVRTTRDALAQFDGPVFATTPDLLDDWPDATWAPVIRRPVALGPSGVRRPGPLRVLSAPTDRAMSRTAFLEALLTRLQDDGVIDYRTVSGVPPAELRTIVADADVVVCKFGLGAYGTLAVEAMMAGRVAFSQLDASVRARIEGEFGPLPVRELDPETFEDELRDLAADPESADAVRAAGTRYAKVVHDGRATVDRLTRRLLDGLD